MVARNLSVESLVELIVEQPVDCWAQNVGCVGVSEREALTDLVNMGCQIRAADSPYTARTGFCLLEASKAALTASTIQRSGRRTTRRPSIRASICPLQRGRPKV